MCYVPCVVKVMQDWREDVKHIGALKHKEEELLVVLTKLPEEDEELLVELDLALGVREIRLDQRVHQQPRHPFEDELKVLLAVNP